MGRMRVAQHPGSPPCAVVARGGVECWVRFEDEYRKFLATHGMREE